MFDFLLISIHESLFAKSSLFKSFKLTDISEDSKLVHRRIWNKVDANFFDSALSHTRRSDASEKKENTLASTLVQIRL